MWRSGRVSSAERTVGRSRGDRDGSRAAGAGTDRELFVEWYGGGVAVSHRDDQPFLLWQLLSATFPASDDLPVRYTRAAGNHASVAAVLRDVVGQAATILARRGGHGRLVLTPVDDDGPAFADGRLVTRLQAAASVPLTAEAALPVTPPPAILASGWLRETNRLYRHAEPRVAVAEVLPAGILLRPTLVYSSGAVAVFRPAQWTISIGSHGRAVPPILVAMLRRLLLDVPAEPVPLQLVIDGEADDATLLQIAALAEELAARSQTAAPDLGLAMTAGSPAAAGLAWPLEDEPDGLSAWPIEDEPDGLSAWPIEDEPDGFNAWPFEDEPDELSAWPPPDREDTWSPPAPAGAGESATVNRAEPEPEPGRVVARRPSGADSSWPPPPATPASTRTPPSPPAPRPTMPRPPIVTIVDPDFDVPSAMPSVGPVRPDVMSEVIEPALVEANEPRQERPADPAGPRWQPAAPLAIADRASTEEEQHRFSAALGSRFTDLLAVVNAAMATWPVLRETSAAAKADFVAVCLYLGASQMGAVRLNEALRGGEPVSVDGYVPCLVSGLRQLPLHRRPVLSQARLDQPASALYPVGSVITEPALLTASVSAEVTAPEADVDFLVWPRTARQASVLVTGNEVDEAVFGPGRRLRVLAVRSGQAESPPSGPPAPATAVLLRELSPDEQPAGPELDDADRAALSRLETTLGRRWAATLRTLEDPAVVARLVGPPPGYVSAGATSGRVGAA